MTARSPYSAWDRAAFRLVAGRHWPGAERVLPPLSRSANHGRLWLALAAGLTAAGGPRAQRAAVRGTASLALASLAANAFAKRSVGRARPLLDAVPLVRQLHRQPVTSSFPSGHAASAAAFAAGVALESRGWGLAVAPVAASVAFSRVYTGVHYPSDVLAGAALGVGAAFTVRGLVPSHGPPHTPARPVARAPALPDGTGLTLIANAASGTAPAPAPGAAEVAGAALRARLPGAQVEMCDPRREDLAARLDTAARSAAAAGGALGVCGGDGTVNAAALAAVRHGVPLAVLPGGTRNHFAADLGIASAADVRDAVAAGQAVAVDLGRFEAGGSGEARGSGATGEAGATGVTGGVFVNTFSLGSYPDLVRVRERWSGRIGPGPAGLLAAWHVLRSARPVEAGLAGRPRVLWLLFAGNCAYRGGLAPVRRYDLADGLLDVRVVRGGSWARTRLLWAALGGALGRRDKRNSAMLRRLLITGIPPGASLSYDGEVAPAPARLLLTKEREALTVYRPLPAVPPPPE